MQLWNFPRIGLAIRSLCPGIAWIVSDLEEWVCWPSAVPRSQSKPIEILFTKAFGKEVRGHGVIERGFSYSLAIEKDETSIQYMSVVMWKIERPKYEWEINRAD